MYTIASHGMGLDSTTIEAIACNRFKAAEWLGITLDELNAKLPRIDEYVFSDTGAEHQHTYDNLRRAEIMLGPQLTIVRKPGETIIEWNERLGTVPVMGGGAHVCSRKYKGDTIAKYVRDAGHEAVRFVIGIEADEGARAKRFSKPRGDRHEYVYPLIDLGITRSDCEDLLEHLGYAIPGKSSCIHCPFKSEAELRDMFFNDRQAWERCADLEARFEEMSTIKHERWLEAGQPVDKAGRALRGMWRRNSFADGRRLFVKTIGGRMLTVREWQARFENELAVRIVDQSDDSNDS